MPGLPALGTSSRLALLGLRSKNLLQLLVDLVTLVEELSHLLGVEVHSYFFFLNGVR